jgi:hypothetical protein
MATAAVMPFAVTIAPFALQKAQEAPVPVVDFGEVGPPRLAVPSSCRYIVPTRTQNIDERAGARNVEVISTRGACL